jgi:sporulation protein YlmC with PRC-barrel domain
MIMKTLFKASAVCVAVLLAGGAWADKHGGDPVVGTVLTGVNAESVATTGYRASKLLGSSIYNDKGEDIGKLEDFIVGSDDSVSVAIIGVGGFLGVDERMVAVPVEVLKMNDKGQLQLSGASKKQLEALPAFIYAE